MYRFILICCCLLEAILLRGQTSSTAAMAAPAGNRVIFYRDACYSGMSRSFGAGAITASSLGFLDGQVSAIYVPEGALVTVYDSRGASQQFRRSVASLSDYGWNDRIRAGSVRMATGATPPPPRGNRLILYKDPSFRGMSKIIEGNRFSHADLGFLGGHVSSFYIPAGKVLRVYDQQGRSQTFPYSVSNLLQIGWDNQVYTGMLMDKEPASLPPQGAKVIAYADPRFGGAARALVTGLNGQATLGMLSGNISSLYIPAGSQVRVSDRRGFYQHFNGSIGNLSQYGWDNRIYTIQVSRDNGDGFQGGNNGGSNGGNNGRVVKLYRDAGYQGQAMQFQEGRFGTLGSFGDNTVSSIEVPPGYVVVAYESNGLKGASRSFTRSVTDLKPFGWNDRIRSVYVYRQ